MVVSTGELAKQMDESQYERGYGPGLQAAATGTTVHLDDAATETRWADYTKVARRRGVLSSVSVFVPVADAGAALNVYSTRANAFDQAGTALAERFAAYVSATLSNLSLLIESRELADHLRHALASREVIDEAKGILMRQRRCGPDEAFAVLVGASQRSNRKLRDVAQPRRVRQADRAPGPGGSCRLTPTAPTDVVAPTSSLQAAGRTAKLRLKVTAGGRAAAGVNRPSWPAHRPVDTKIHCALEARQWRGGRLQFTGPTMHTDSAAVPTPGELLVPCRLGGRAGT